MKHRYLIFIGLMMAYSSCNPKLDCPAGIIDCGEEIHNSYLDSDICECICSKSWPGGLYKSPIDGRSFCWDELGPDWSTDYELYAFDHQHIHSDGFEERVLGQFEIIYDGTKLVEREGFPYVGKAENSLYFPLSGFKGCNKPNIGPWEQPFYMKENNRDTLFMDQLFGFWSFNSHVICGDSYFTKSFMVRRDDGMDWYKELYRYPQNGDDVYTYKLEVHNGVIAPDTTFFIHMPLLLKKG